jgi:prepilin-type N-terminal cleavage/methylation domain-containing protein
MIVKLRRDQKGFTIIELMIATAVLSTILVFVTIVMVNIGSLYYKGINQSRVQDDVRSISSDIIANTQITDKAPIGPYTVPGVSNSYVYCVGPARYFYVLGVQVGTPPVGGGPVFNQILWRDNNPQPGNCPTEINPANPSSPQVNLTSNSLSNDDAANQGEELITSNSRLIAFSINTPSSSEPSIVTVGVAYGDNDLLCNPTADPGSCNNPAAMTSLSSYTGNVLCKGLKGKQFCSTANITSSAVRRVGGGGSH